MRPNPFMHITRIACVVSSFTLFAVAPIGCGGDSGGQSTTVGQLPPEATQANNNMADFVKNKSAEKKK